MLCVENYSRDWMTLGFANSPAIYDEKTTQTEFKIIAQHKTIEFDVNYLQTVVRDIVRQFILHARVQFYEANWGIDPAPAPHMEASNAADISSTPMAS